MGVRHNPSGNQPRATSTPPCRFERVFTRRYGPQRSRRCRKKSVNALRACRHRSQRKRRRQVLDERPSNLTGNKGWDHARDASSSRSHRTSESMASSFSSSEVGVKVHNGVAGFVHRFQQVSEDRPVGIKPEPPPHFRVWNKVDVVAEGESSGRDLPLPGLSRNVDLLNIEHPVDDVAQLDLDLFELTNGLASDANAWARSAVVTIQITNSFSPRTRTALLGDGVDVIEQWLLERTTPTEPTHLEQFQSPPLSAAFAIDSQVTMPRTLRPFSITGICEKS